MWSEYGLRRRRTNEWQCKWRAWVLWKMLLLGIPNIKGSACHLKLSFWWTSSNRVQSLCCSLSFRCSQTVTPGQCKYQLIGITLRKTWVLTGTGFSGSQWELVFLSNSRHVVHLLTVSLERAARASVKRISPACCFTSCLVLKPFIQSCLYLPALPVSLH